jgi:cation:H+ antiporter
MYLQALGGFVLLFAGGELLVRGAVSTARRLGVSPLLIGMTIVAAATSAPELVVSMQAALGGQPDIAVGNVVGSNIANVLLILGASALVAPIVFDRREVRRDTGVVLAVSILLVILVRDGDVSRPEGVTLVATLISYLFISYWLETHRDAPGRELHEHEAEEFAETTKRPWAATAYLAFGLLALVAGSSFLVDGASAIASVLGVSEAVIGLTMVAVGTSLPEFATSLAAAARGHFDVAVGNVVGSNIFNIAGILGLTAIVQPVPVSASIATGDALVMLGSMLAVTPLLLLRGRIGRLAGATLVLAYAAYVAWRYVV